ncbi:MAG: radical SAM protein [Vulcanimicrobiota bacterium]
MFLYPPLSLRERLFGQLEMPPEKQHTAESITKASLNRKHIHLYKYGDQCVLLNSRNLKKIYGDTTLSDLYNLLRDEKADAEAFKDKFGNDACKLVYDTGFMLPAPVRDLSEEVILPETLDLIITSRCNLRCRYCRNIPEEQDMSVETAKKALDFFFSITSCEAPTIALSGGEPLSNWNTVSFILDYVEKKSNAQIVLQTNGTLLTAGRAGLLKRHNVKVWFSIDGQQKHHDLMRVNSYGRASWSDSLKGHTMYKKEAKTSFINCRVSYHNRRCLEEIAHYFFHELEARQVRFTLMDNKAADDAYPFTGEDLAGSLYRAFEILRRIGVTEKYMEKRLKAFVYEEPLAHLCGNNIRRLAVTPEGQMGTCHILASQGIHLIGHIDKINDSAVLSHAGGEALPCECRECPALGICGGPCAAMDAKNMSSYLCQFHKALIELMMRDLGSIVGQNTSIEVS